MPVVQVDRNWRICPAVDHGHHRRAAGQVAAAGHDRCIVPIKPGHIDEWLDPGSTDTKRLFENLDDRERPNYEHRMAA